MKQTERSDMMTPEQLAHAFGVSPASVRCSGGKIDNFKQGWARDIWSTGRRAHYYIRSGRQPYATARCGVKGNAHAMFGAGNHVKCRRCEA